MGIERNEKSIVIKLRGVRYVGVLLYVVFCLVVVFCVLGYYRTSARVAQASYQEVLADYSRRVEQLFAAMDLDVNHLDSSVSQELRLYFAHPILERTGYPFLLHPSGRVLFHFYRDGSYFPFDVVERMANTPGRAGMLEMPAAEGSALESMMSFFYLPGAGCYFCVETDREVFDERMSGLRLYGYLLGTVLLLVFVVVSYLLRRWRGYFDKMFYGRLRSLSQGELPDDVDAEGPRMVREMAKSFNVFLAGMRRTTAFVLSLGRGEFDREFVPLSSKDQLGNALVAMRRGQQENMEERSRREHDDEIRNWRNQGLAQFAQLLREHNDTIDKLSESLLEHLVNYLDAVQGGIFVVEEREEGGSYLRLSAAFAYSRKKYIQEEVQLGEGIVGTCAIERAMIHLDKLPPEYCEITSGIGHTPPRELLVVPLQTDEALLGVLELASLQAFEPHVVDFVSALSASIAQTLQTVQTGQRTSELLRESQEQRETMRSQEEEMRQNLEEMQATQEEMLRRRQDAEALRAAVDASMLYAELSVDGEVVHSNVHYNSFVQQFDIEQRDGNAFLSSGYVVEGGQEGAGRLADQWDAVLRGEPLLGDYGWRDASGKVKELRVVLRAESDALGRSEKVLLLAHELAGGVN